MLPAYVDWGASYFIVNQSCLEGLLYVQSFTIVFYFGVVLLT